MKLGRKSFLAATGAALSGAFGFPPIIGAAAEPIRIGSLPPLTGSNALLGIQERDGIRLAVDEINARAGKVYDARPFEIVEEDATNDNESAVSALNGLLGKNVVAIVCPVLSTQIQAMAPIMKTHAVPWMTGGTAVLNTQLGVPGLFRVRASDAIVTAAMTNFAVKDKHGRKIAILHAADAFGISGADRIAGNLKAMGMEPAAKVQYPRDTTDFSAEILQIRQSGADVLTTYIQNPSDAAAVLKQIRSLGLNIPIVGSPSLGNQIVIQAVGNDASGIYAAVDFIAGSNSAVASRFLTSFYRRYHHQADVGTGAGWVYDAVYLLAGVYKNQRSADPGRTIAAIKKLHNWQGALGTFNADGEGNLMHAVAIGQIEDGKLRFVKTVAG